MDYKKLLKIACNEDGGYRASSKDHHMTLTGCRRLRYHNYHQNVLGT